MHSVMKHDDLARRTRKAMLLLRIYRALDDSAHSNDCEKKSRASGNAIFRATSFYTQK